MIIPIVNAVMLYVLAFKDWPAVPWQPQG